MNRIRGFVAAVDERLTGVEDEEGGDLLAAEVDIYLLSKQNLLATCVKTAVRNLFARLHTSR